jgi:hypothetical protein
MAAASDRHNQQGEGGGGEGASHRAYCSCANEAPPAASLPVTFWRSRARLKRPEVTQKRAPSGFGSPQFEQVQGRDRWVALSRHASIDR